MDCPGVLRTMNTVSKVKVISSSDKAPKSAPSLTGRPPSSSSGTGRPRSSSSIPWRMHKKPLPPASTTPAFFSTGFWLTVLARAAWPSAMAASSTASTLLCSWAASDALAAASRDTVRMVPSAGFITAL